VLLLLHDAITLAVSSKIIGIDAAIVNNSYPKQTLQSIRLHKPLSQVEFWLSLLLFGDGVVDKKDHFEDSE
jgi:hypothetical protein